MRLLPLLLSALFSAASVAAEKPNIVFIMVDDLGPEWISSYGGELIETPNVDELARRGLSFDNAYSMPQCTPTRATLLTGQYPFRHGWVNHWDVPRWGAGAHFDPEKNITFARLLREAGYRTGIAGKWQINDFRVQPEALRDHGFDEWSVWTGYETGNPPSGERYWDPYVFTNTHPSKTYEGGFGPLVFNDFAVEFVERHRDEPWMLYYPMAITHTPLVTTPHEPFAETPHERHRAMVRYMDFLVGRLMKKLDDLGLSERTYVFFTTDNGTTRGITGRMDGREVEGGKASLKETGAREPFIVAGPGVGANTRTEALTDFTDLLPTFVDLTGARLPDGIELDGHSIRGVLDGSDADGEREWIMAMGFGFARLDEAGVRPVLDYADRVIRDERYKAYVVRGRVARLYDLERDQGEERNLRGSSRPEHREAIEKFRAVAAGFPEKDGRPRYSPLPPQPWDQTIKENEAMRRR